MQFDPYDPNMEKSIRCKYCEMPINKPPIVLLTKKIYFLFEIGNFPVHAECAGPYMDSLKNRTLAVIGIIIAVLSILITIL